MRQSYWDPAAKSWIAVAPGEHRPHARERYRNQVTCAGWFGKLRMGERAVLTAAIDGATDALVIPNLHTLDERTGLAVEIVRRTRTSLVERGLIVPTGEPGRYRLAIPNGGPA